MSNDFWFNGLPIGPNTGASWFNGLPIPTIPVRTVVGVGATGSAGSLVGSVPPFSLVGIAATGNAGSVSSAVNTLILGVSATGGLSSITPEVDSRITGVVATGTIGTITLPQNFIVGASGTGSVGTIHSDASITLVGCTGACATGMIFSAVSVGITGVTGTGSSATAIDTTSAIVPSVAATGTAASLVALGFAGATATGNVGRAYGDVVDALIGVQASAQIGSLQSDVGGVGGTAEGIGQAGSIEIDIFVGAIITGVVGIAGVADPEGARTILGVSGNTLTGLMRANPGANLNSVGLAGLAGSFVFDTLKNVTGVAATGQIGLLQGGIPQPVLGVQASAQIGPITKDQTKLITGVQATGRATQFTNAFLFGNAATGQAGSIAKIDTKLITGVQGISGLGALLPNLVTPVRYYLTARSNFGSLVPNVQPTPAVTGTGWKVGRTATGQFGILKYNNEQNVFSSTTQLSALPTATNGNSWRTENPINGTINAGVWTISMAFRAATRLDGQAGRVRVRIYRATGSNGAGAVEITSSELVGTSTGTLSTTVDRVSFATFTTLAPILLTNEYLFITTEWEIQTAGGNPNDDVDYSLGANSFIELPITAVNANVGGVAASGSAGLLAAEENIVLASASAIGSAGTFISAKDTQFALPGVFATCDHGVFDFIVAANIRGIQALGISNHPFSQVALIGSISLVSANGVGFAGDIGIPMAQPVTGNAATGQAGDISADTEKEVSLAGVTAATNAGVIVGADDQRIDLDGATAAGDAGAINGGIELIFDGVSGFAVVGSLTPDQQRLLHGVFGTGFAGPVRRQPDIAAALPSVFATGDAATCTDYRIDSVLTGVEAQGNTSDLPFELTSLLQTDPMLGQIGDINAEVDQFWPGVEAQGFVGRLHPNSALMDGAGATGAAGTIIAKGRSRGGNQRLLPRIVHTVDGGQVLWYDVTAPLS